MSEHPYVLHGLKLSYFTGKMEAYLRAKGIAFRFVEMDMADFRRCARATGVAQMPQLETPDGGWLTDTTAIIAHFEQTQPAPRLHPVNDAARFVSLLLEDAFDEWLWRPALYYRWAFEEDARLMGRQIARTMLRDLPGPLALRSFVIRRRQQREYLRRDGVTPQTAPVIAALYGEVLDLLEPVLAARPFLFGARPCEADFGLFGPMFRHFSSDPTPAAILRERAPHVLAWTARLWATTPADLADAPDLTEAPADLDPLLGRIGRDHLPELDAQAAAVAQGHARARFTVQGVAWDLPASPYRASCLASLQRRFAALAPADRDVVAARIGPGAEILAGAPLDPPARAAGGPPTDRHGVGR
jgi:glutathione S-transferase